MQVELIRTATDFEALGDAWADLLAESEANSPFLDWAWQYQWWRHYGEHRELALVTVRDCGRLVGIAPLYVDRVRAGTRVLRFLGTPEACSEWLGFVIEPGREFEVAGHILDFLHHDMADAWDLMELTDLPEHTDVLAAIDGQLGVQGRTYRREPGWSYYIVDLPDSWDAYLKSVSSNRRSRLRRMLRDMDKAGMRFVEAADPGQLDEAWQHLRRLHRMRRDVKGGGSSFDPEPLDRFHRSLLRSFLDRGELCLSLLRNDDEVIAASYCLRRNGHVYFYQSGSDPAWERCRVGHAIRALEFQKAIERGDRQYDFLGGDMDYKRQWATSLVPTARLVVSAPRLTARARYHGQAMVRRARCEAKRLAPEWLRNVARSLSL